MQICSDTGKLRWQRIREGGLVSGLLICGILLAHSVWPMQTWSIGGFWMLWFAVMFAGAWVAIKPRRSGSYACLDDAGVNVQMGRRSRRLAWSAVSSVARSEYSAGARRLDFEDLQGNRLRVDLAVFADETAVCSLVRRHLPWADSDAWAAHPDFRIIRKNEE